MITFKEILNIHHYINTQPMSVSIFEAEEEMVAAMKLGECDLYPFRALHGKFG